MGFPDSVRHNADLVAQALLQGLENYPAPWIAHSDQGSEYRSQIYLNLLKSLDIQPSMSEKASPWQNGHKESFYSGFKLELGHPECYLTLGELIEAIAQQIHYYNNQRIHTALKCPPAVFAKRIALSEILTKNDALECPRKTVSGSGQCLIPILPGKTLSPLDTNLSNGVNKFSKVEFNNLLIQEIAETQSV